MSRRRSGIVTMVAERTPMRLPHLAAVATLAAATLAAADPVSFYQDVREVLQVHCSGCHQPANQLSGLDLTNYEGVLRGGSKHGSSITKGAPDRSPLIGLVTGRLEPRMPMGGAELAPDSVDLLTRWVREGAVDDTPAEARAPQAPTDPPRYEQAPAITGMAFSPDGSLLAVGGFKEVLLHRSDGSAIEARLLGRSDKIHSVHFSPDGKRLVAIGGTPARFGEVQVWDLETRTLEHSVMATPDTLFAGDISPDGTRAVFGAADKAIRVVELQSGEVLFQAGHHEDWVLQSVFGIDGKRIVSVGRDRAAKLAEGASGAFLENVNFLRDKLYAIARHPRRDYVLIGGEDRVPYLYTMDRPRALKIADDSTLVRKFEEQSGQIFALAFSPDGSRIVVAGVAQQVPVYDSESGSRLATCEVREGGTFVVAFHPSGDRLATGGFDGVVRIFDSSSGEQIRQFVPVPVDTAEASGAPDAGNAG